MMWFEKVSKRFDVLEPPRTQPELVHKHPVHIASPGREGSVKFNHPELKQQNWTHLDINGVVSFEKVR